MLAVIFFHADQGNPIGISPGLRFREVQRVSNLLGLQ
jgi:hypothetical protein